MFEAGCSGRNFGGDSAPEPHCSGRNFGGRSRRSRDRESPRQRAWEELEEGQRVRPSSGMRGGQGESVERPHHVGRQPRRRRREGGSGETAARVFLLGAGGPGECGTMTRAWGVSKGGGAKATHLCPAEGGCPARAERYNSTKPGGRPAPARVVELFSEIVAFSAILVARTACGA